MRGMRTEASGGTGKDRDGIDVTASERARLDRAIVRLSKIFWRQDLRRWRPLIVAAVLLTLLAKGFAVTAPLLIGDAINVIGDAGSFYGLPIFVWLLLGYGAARFLSQALPQFRDMFFVPVTQDAVRMIAVEAFGHAQSLSLQFHLTRRAGALNRIMERGAGATEFLLRFLAFTIGPTLIELALAAIVLQQRYGWQFAAISLATVLGYAVFTIIVTEWRTRQRRVLNEADTEVKAQAVDSLTNFEVVKAFGAEERETLRFDQSLRGFSKLFVRSMRSLAWLNTGQEFIMNAGLVAMAMLAAYGAAGGRMSAGDITAVVLILINIYRPLNILGFAWREIKQGMVDMEKLFALLDIKPGVADRLNAQPLANPQGAIRFEDVGFRHEGRQAGLKDINLTIEPGQYVGLVGPSGAGKSTILKLLFRFYDPDGGAIHIGGQDLRDIRQADLRRHLGLVPQDVVLFNDTLRYNLGYARPAASDADILAAADQAQLTQFIGSLPDGLDTRVGERGLKLSGGEKQRVGIARVLLKDPAILILDEATSALDSTTEAEVQRAIDRAATNRTTIAVAHRLSTLAGADMICVLDGGRIVAAGAHTDLLDTSPLYGQMWARQQKDNTRATDHETVKLV